MKEQNFSYFYEQNFKVEHQRTGKEVEVQNNQSQTLSHCSGLKNIKTKSSNQLQASFRKSETKK